MHFMLAMEGDKGMGEAYLIADEEYLEIEDIVKKVGKALNIDVKIKHYPILPVIIVGHIVEKYVNHLKLHLQFFRAELTGTGKTEL